MFLTRAPAHSDAGADRIDLGISAVHGNLCPISRLTGNRFQFDSPVGNFTHFDFKQAADEIGMAARKDDLRTTGSIVHGDDVGAKPISDTVLLGYDPLTSRHSSFEFSQIQDDVGFFKAADGSADDLAGPILEFLIDHILFDLADTLVDGLARSLRRDASKIPRRYLDLNLLSGLNTGLERTRLGNKNLIVGILNTFDGNELG